MDTSASPSPEPGRPRALPARASSLHTAGRSACGTPIPVSATSMVTVPDSSRPRTSTVPPGEVYFEALEMTL